MSYWHNSNDQVNEEIRLKKLALEPCEERIERGMPCPV